MKEQFAGRSLATLFVLLAVSLLLVERLPPVLAILAVVALCIGADWRAATSTIRSGLALWAIAALAVWMLVTAFWSIAGAEAWSRGGRIAATVLAASALPVLAFTLPTRYRTLAARWALAASVMAVALLFIETTLDMPLLRTARYLFNREIFTDTFPATADRAAGYAYYNTLYLSNRLTHLSSVVAILLLPLAAVLCRHGLYLRAIGISAAALAALLLAPAQTPLLALGLGLLAAGIALVPVIARSTWVAPAGGLVLASAVIASPWLAQTAYDAIPKQAGAMDLSIFHRLAIWDHAAGLIAERPVLGYGIEAARVIGREGVNVAEDAKGFAVTFEALPLHPHNASIQVWLELGGIGALILAVFLYVMTLVVWSRSRQPLLRAGLVGGWISALSVAHLSYGIWQYWWLATLGMVAAMLALMIERAEPVAAPEKGSDTGEGA